MLVYPESLPLPLQNDYAVSVAPNIKRSTMSDGWIRQRKVTSNTPDSVTVSFYFNEVQMGVFLDFIEALNEGADWFKLKLPTNVIDDNEDHVIALRERVVRFQSGKYSEKLNFYEGTQWLWKITATLDIQKDRKTSWHYAKPYSTGLHRKRKQHLLGKQPAETSASGSKIQLQASKR